MKKYLILPLLAVASLAFAVINPTGKTWTEVELVTCADGKQWTVCGPGNEIIVPTFGPQSSTAATDWGFDFVETFDGLDDWSAESYSSGNYSSVGSSAAMPKIAGGDSAWNYFSNYDATTAPEPWIAAYGDGRVWRGTKSATLDLDSGTGKGPSRLGVYFGDGAGGGGYTDFYAFWMVKFPVNHFPTQSANCADAGVDAEWYSGQDYIYCAFYKHYVPQVGCPSAECYSPGFGYSPVWNLVFDLLRHGGSKPVTAEDGLYFYTVNNQRDGNYEQQYAYDSDQSIDTGVWIGIEVRHRLDGVNATTDIWTYDTSGNVLQAATGQTWTAASAADGEVWNQIHFGGNKSWGFGATMESSYNIDDVIIDDQRIGPKYFDCIGVTAGGSC